VEIVAWSAAPDKAAAYAQIAGEVRTNSATLFAHEGDGRTVQPVARAQRKAHGFGWAALFFIGSLSVAMNFLKSPHTQSTDSSYVGSPLGALVLGRGGNSTLSHSSFGTVPEAHLNGFERAIDGSLENCIDFGRDVVGPYLHSICRVSARVRVLRPSGGEPMDVTLSVLEKDGLSLR
jgi:hypothetical protein